MPVSIRLTRLKPSGPPRACNLLGDVEGPKEAQSLGGLPWVNTALIDAGNTPTSQKKKKWFKLFLQPCWILQPILLRMITPNDFLEGF